MSRATNSTLGLLIFSALTTVSLAANATTVVPSAADVGNVNRSEPVSKPAVSTAAPITRAPVAAHNQNEKQQFTLGGVKVNGVTAFPAGAFDDLYKDKVGKKVSVAEMNGVARAIADRYVAAGYILATAALPKQTIKDDGVITIVVNEGHIGNVVFEGDKPSDSVRGLANDYVARLKAESPLKSDALERYLLLINDIPGNSAHAVLKPSTTEPGATDVVILYKTKPIDLSVSTDNRSSRYLGPWQTSVSAAENSVLGLGERTVVRAIVSSPTQELRYFDLQHEEPIGSDGTRLLVVGSTAKTEPGDALKNLDIRGESDDLLFRVTHPFIRSRAENLTVRGIYDLRNSDTDILASNQNKDHVRSLRAGGTYDFADGFDGVNLIDLEASKGITGLGATDDGAGRTRINGRQEYTKANFDVSRTQALPSNFSLFLASSGQYAFDPLLASEQFLLGGSSFGTAYDPGELAGDDGLDGKVELRYGQTVGQPYFESYQAYTYYDVGTVWRRKELASEESRDSLASAGFGVRANITQNISSNLEFAFPLTKPLAADPDNTARVFGAVTVRY